MNRIKELFYLYLYLGVIFVFYVNIPKSISIYYETRAALLSLGVIGVWRYTWWLIHVVRSVLFTYVVFPGRRLKADQLWQDGWRPKRLIFMMTTFKELKEITEKVLGSLVDECHEVGVPVKLYVGIGDDSDETVIQSYLAQISVSVPLHVQMVRQKKAGKRFAIGETCRAIVRDGLEQNDVVIFMDGDTYFEPGCLRKCLPFFFLYPKMQALTTHEQAIIVNGPAWMTKWLDMRFAQRDFTMRSYSLSNKILTLTGRMSIFRGKHILEPEFINIVEYDHLTHWLWGQYRFLSGDDKSTWYYLLKSGADMFYIPDALTTTIEYISGSPLDRMKENLRRWSGNTLRNGERAIALGPRRVGFYIWWCLVDQRIAIWTMPVGLTITFVLALLRTPAFILVSIIWIGLSRLMISMILFCYARRIDMAFPFILYFNQLMTCIIKIYILFRLPQQKWKNRGDQQVGFVHDNRLTLKRLTASYLTMFYCLLLLLCVLYYLNVIQVPDVLDIKMLFNS